jgi:hypothetical protein
MPRGRLASSSRSQVPSRAASAAARLTWERSSISVRWCRLLVVAIVTHLVTPSPAARGTGCGTLTTMTAVLTTLLGGCLAIAGGLVGIALGDRRERSRWLRDSQWQASTNLLGALQLVIRRMITVSYLDEKKSVDPAIAAVTSFSEATVAWNSALYSALLITPPEVAAKIPELDREVDRLNALARSRRWARGEFRQERVRLGQMAAEYLRRARQTAGLPDIDLPSIWAWDTASDQPDRAGETSGPTA